MNQILTFEYDVVGAGSQNVLVEDNLGVQLCHRTDTSKLKEAMASFHMKVSMEIERRARKTRTGAGY
jgi:hypothetical protein